MAHKVLEIIKTWKKSNSQDPYDLCKRIFEVILEKPVAIDELIKETDVRNKTLQAKYIETSVLTGCESKLLKEHRHAMSDNDILGQIKTALNRMPSFVVVYLISLLNKHEHLLLRNLFIFNLGSDVLQKYLPGILGYYFSIILADISHEANMSCLMVINHILAKNINIDDTGLDKLYFTLTNINCKDVSDMTYTSILCKNLYSADRQMYFLFILISCSCNLSEMEYKIVGAHITKQLNKIEKLPADRVDELERILSILVTAGKYTLTCDVFKKICCVYTTKPRIYGLFRILQEYALNGRPVVHKLAVDTDLNDCCISRHKKIYMPNCIEGQNVNYEVEMLMAIVKSSRVQNHLRQTPDICKIAKKYEHDVLEWFYLKLDELKKKKMQKEKKKNALVYHEKQQIFDFDKSMYNVLMWYSNYCKLNTEAYQVTVISCILNILHEITRKESVLIVLDIIQRALIHKKHLLEPVFVESIFHKIVFLDFDCASLRSIKYEIIKTLLERLFSSERKVKSDKEMSASVYLPLVAKLWDEICILPEDEEILAVIKLLREVVEQTDKFYQRRLCESDVLAALFDFAENPFRSGRKNKTVEEFVKLLDIMMSNFELKQPLCKRIWFVMSLYFDDLELSNTARKFAVIDKTHCLNTLFTELKIDKLSRIGICVMNVLQDKMISCV